MKKLLQRIVTNGSQCYYYNREEKVSGVHNRIRGDVSNIWGDVSGIRGNVSNIWGNVSGIRGDVSNISGDVSNIWGNVSGIRGNVSGISGDLDECEISHEEIIQGIQINDLII